MHCDFSFLFRVRVWRSQSADRNRLLFICNVRRLFRQCHRRRMTIQFNSLQCNLIWLLLWFNAVLFVFDCCSVTTHNVWRRRLPSKNRIESVLRWNSWTKRWCMCVLCGNGNGKCEEVIVRCAPNRKILYFFFRVLRFLVVSEQRQQQQQWDATIHSWSWYV